MTAARGRACLLFAGQSVQETGMGAALWKLAPAREILERLRPSLGDDLERLTTTAPEEELALTVNSQRAIHAHHLGHWFAYKARHPDAALDGAIGHSMGVVAALVAANALSVEDSGVFMRARADSFSRACRGFSAPMGLAAVSTDDFRDVVDEAGAFPGVSVALHNTLRRGVLGGTLADLEAFSRKADEEGWPLRIKVLKVEGPYHTPAFSSCKPELELALEKITLRAPEVPVYMGTSGQAETDPQRIKRLLVEQADHCELHLSAVQAAYRGGCRRFLEVAHKPQPVTWLAEQLLDLEGPPWPGVTAEAVRTDDLAA